MTGAGFEREPDRLIRELLDPSAYPHPVRQIELIETHISWVILTGDYVYKIKKPVDLGFVDFSTLLRRRHFCCEELRLNRRTASALYEAVVPIGEGPSGPMVGREPAVEYAVKMRQFPSAQRLDRQLQDGRLDWADLFRAGMQIAAFHEQQLPWRWEADEDPGQRAPRPALNNLDHLESEPLRSSQRARVASLAQWTRSQVDLSRATFMARYRAGRVRDCHGDLHLANLYRDGDRIVPFDCLEFDPLLRRIDLASDIAFLVMDLLAEERPDLAFAVLNGWLEANGDYRALAVLRFYLVYRALVRVKVACVRFDQGLAGGVQAVAEIDRYLGLAEAIARRPGALSLILMHGLPGSGKTWASGRVMTRLPAVRVRSDVERKRLLGLPPAYRGASAWERGLYAPEFTDRAYGALAEACRTGLDAGWNMLADATFPDQKRRRPFISLATNAGAEPVVLHCRAEDATLRRRLQRRAENDEDASDADRAVLCWARNRQQPPQAVEGCRVVDCRTDQPIDWAGLCAALRPPEPRAA